VELLNRERKVSEMNPEEIKQEVSRKYSKVAARGRVHEAADCCRSRNLGGRDETRVGCCNAHSTTTIHESDCCSNPESLKPTEYAKSIGYDISKLPRAATESFAGCGNPVALATLREGEIVVDLGSGAGLDVFVAAEKVGAAGRVIGIDMTAEMLESARKSATEMGMTNVEFREGDIEDLPIDDSSVDVVVSNCVINLAPNKAGVFEEAHRILRPGGRILISDIVLEEELSPEERDSLASYTGCLGGAILEQDYLELIWKAGFERVSVMDRTGYGRAISAKIRAYKPPVE
jgi:SAM-dependent methyltransferase